jgi:ankyrin repeat protein
MPRKIFLTILFILTAGVIYQCSPGEEKKVQKEVSDMKNEIINAVNKNDYKKTKELLENGADINTKDERDRTLLMIAVYNNYYEISKLLIENKADINIQDDMKNNPFLYSGAEGQLEILKLLVKAGADTKITNRYGGVALIPASERGHTETVRYLLENTDIDVNHINNLGWTALLEAIILGNGGKDHIEIVKLLLEHGADPDIADRNGVTPLEHARDRNFKEIESLLIKSGAK